MFMYLLYTSRYFLNVMYYTLTCPISTGCSYLCITYSFFNLQFRKCYHIQKFFMIHVPEWVMFSLHIWFHFNFVCVLLQMKYESESNFISAKLSQNSHQIDTKYFSCWWNEQKN